MTNEKKIVQPGEVNVEGDSTKADENTKPNQNQNTTQNSQYSNSDRDIENMVKIGFLLGKKEQRPEIKKSSGGFTLSFLMPKGAKPGDTITAVDGVFLGWISLLHLLVGACVFLTLASAYVIASLTERKHVAS